MAGKLVFSRAILALLAVWVVALAGCGDDGSGGTDSGGASVDASGSADLGVADAESPDVAQAGTDAAIAELNTGGPDAKKSCPGVAGCACAKNSDCDNALCIDTPNGKQCAETCIDKCGDGFKCAGVNGSGGDVQTVCVPTYGKLCDPCTTSAACTALGQKTPVCASHGDNGLFCGAECTADTDCPKDFACTDVKTAEGTAAKTCVPKGDGKSFGACTCSPAAIAATLSTTCMAPAKDDKGNVVGGCPGARTCGKDGLSACNAPAAVPEICDGLDNDCNGKTDEGTCDDGNACTADACAKGADGKLACDYKQLDTPCDDKNACTEGDVCKAGACAGGANKVCADNNVCTIDTCDPALGCAQAFDDGAPCDDDNPCTTGDLCQQGKCLSGLPKDCTSTDACQTAKCDQTSGKCAFTDKQDGLPCNDNTVCTQKDVCKSGACNGELILCDDGNPCTADACDNATGCTATNADLACTDSNACTQGDKCAAGACMAGAKKNCDDGDGCTLDSCDAVSGACVNGAINGCGGNCKVDGDCNDGNPCTTDSCAAGKCAVAANTAKCDDKNVCTDNDTCADSLCAGTLINCDDKNVCTTDSCDAGTGCGHAANSLGCDDGNECTVGDACADSACKAGDMTVCDDKNPCTDDTCDPKTGKCATANNKAPCSDDNACTNGDTCALGLCGAGTPTVCDDKNPCTDDKCNPANGACAATNNTVACSDSDACTAGDVCLNGACKSGVAKVCDDKDACTIDSCNKTTGACAVTPIVGCGGNCKLATDCNDSNPCTTDSCTAGKCAFAPNTLACDDKNGCTLGDVCAGGVCKPGAAKVCNDGNGCTDDSCDTATGSCKATANVAPCNDSDPCTLSDTCTATVCKGTPMNCNDNNPCTVGEACVSGACVAGTPVVCDDKNVCTNDSCDKATGKCAFANNVAACTDGNACTLGDVCAAGVCKAGAAQNCDDKNVCTTDSCDTKTGLCAHANNTAACTDNNACTVGDKCAVGLCSAGTLTVCDDKNDCTQDKCILATGLCDFTNYSFASPCSDGNLCTTGDKCDGAGKCVAGPAVICKGTTCLANACSPATGTCVSTPMAATVACDDLQACTKGDHCDGTGKCQSGPWDNTCGCQTAATCDDKNPCTADTCVSNKCVFTVTANAACDDGDVCTTASKCDANGKCLGTANYDCTASADQCNTGACFDNGGVAACKKAPKTVGTACSDGLFCTTGEACDASGKCAGGLPVSCGKPAQCYQSLCTEAAKGCSTPFQPKGFACTDNSICTGNDVCDGAGKCAGTLLDSCTPVLTGFNPASPAIAQATAGVGTATATTGVYLYPAANCAGAAANAVAVTASPAFSVPFTAAKQACTTVSAQAVDAGGTKSACSNNLVFNNYSCTQCPCGDSDYIRRFGSTKTDVGVAVTVDASGNSYVVGSSDGAVSPGVSAGGYDVFVTKMNGTGVRQWTTQIGTALDDNAGGIALDATGNLWIVGRTAGDIDGAGPIVGPAAGDTDGFVMKLDPATGKVLLTKSWGTAARQESINALKWDATNARLVAMVMSSAVGGNGQSPQVITIAPATGVVAKLWDYIDDSQNKSPVGLHVSAAGNIYIHGRSQWGIAGALSTTGVNGSSVMYVYKITAAGTVAWLQHWGSDAFDYAGGITTDGAGTVYATGYAQGLAIGAPAGTVYAGSNGTSWGYYGDLVVGAFNDTTGAPVWVYQAGTAGGDAGLAAEWVSGKGGGLWITGVTGGNMENSAAASKYGLQDLFIAKINSTGALVSMRQLGTAGNDGVVQTFRVPGSLVGGTLYMAGWSDVDWIGQSPDACAPQTTREAVVGKWCL